MIHMKKTIYYLPTCSTCQRIMKELGVDDSWIKRDIKSSPILKKEVDAMKRLSGNYESLFSRRSMKYRAWGLNEKLLTESDYRDLITKEYTFLKRPVVILDEDIYIGNSRAAIEGAKEKLGQ